MNNSRVLKRAHELTKQFIKQYPDVDYHTELGLMIHLVNEEILNGILDREVVFPFRYADEGGIDIVKIQQTKTDTFKGFEGVIRVNNIEQYFVASNEHPLPIIYGSKNIDELIALRHEIDALYPGFYIKPLEQMHDMVYNYNNLSMGIFVYSIDGIEFKGYYRNRAFVFNRQENKYPKTCAFKTLIKNLERNNKSYRSMKGAGIQIENEIELVLNICREQYINMKRKLVDSELVVEDEELITEDTIENTELEEKTIDIEEEKDKIKKEANKQINKNKKAKNMFNMLKNNINKKKQI